jgi:hypothetical protein
MARPHRDFWVAVNNNFFDMCVLDWCKLFTRKSEKHYYRRCQTLLTHRMPSGKGVWSAMALLLGQPQPAAGLALNLRLLLPVAPQPLTLFIR